MSLSGILEIWSWQVAELVSLGGEACALGGAKKYFNRLIARSGYCLSSMRHHAPVDTGSYRVDPVSLYYQYPNKDLVIEAPSCWGYGGFDYKLDIAPRLSRCLKHEIGSKEYRSKIRQALVELYSCWQPRSAAEWFFMNREMAPELAEFEPWACPWPWEAVDIYKRIKNGKQDHARENALISGKMLGLEAGWKYCGPVSDEKLEIEVERFARVISAIAMEGYRRNVFQDGDIVVRILRHPGGQWRWQVMSGQHRYIAMKALGYETIPVRAVQIIWRDDVLYWPNVTNGLFTPEAALEVFDHSL